jgi:hypothetical protein
VSTSLAIALAACWALLELTNRGAMTRRLLREVTVVFIHIELLAMRVVRLFVRPKFVITGECVKCGACCEQILGDPPRLVKDTPWLLGLFVGWHRVVHNFHLVARGESGEVVFRCGYLKGDGRCGIYRLRPFICRNYPVLPFYEAPRPLPGCSLGVAPVVVAKMQRRASLPIVDSAVAVHHPTRPRGEIFDEPAHYERVAES